ncbi:MAG: orotidine-5'-phosphate decarboxylase [Neisseriaceae bacterium]
MNIFQIQATNGSTDDSPVIVALDVPTEEEALQWVARLTPELCQLKIGNELFTATGRKFVESLVLRGFRVFLDLKYHDIPNTVSRACRVAGDMGVWMVNVHIDGGREMLEAAANALASFSHRPLLVGVTVLTSLDLSDLLSPQAGFSLERWVMQKASLAKSSGLDGVVCSAQEVKLIKEQLGYNFLTITPGIRVGTLTQDDQKRTLTPEEALSTGTDYLVMGRPIRQTRDPVTLLRELNQKARTIRSQIVEPK